MQQRLDEKKWWVYLDPNMQELMEQAHFLLEEAKSWGIKFDDYSFVVFPAAKAYEGFLKKFFLELGLISQEDYSGKHFRIGKALNASLEKHLRDDDWVYKKLSDYCNGEDLPEALWEAWKKGRNLVFHWFPGEKSYVSLEEARERVELIVAAMDKALEECKINYEG
jgi:hypothetical protein